MELAGMSDIEGKAAREAASAWGKEPVSNGREHMSQRGQRTSFQLIRSLPRGLLPRKVQTKKEQLNLMKQSSLLVTAALSLVAASAFAQATKLSCGRRVDVNVKSTYYRVSDRSRD